MSPSPCLLLGFISISITAQSSCCGGPLPVPKFLRASRNGRGCHLGPRALMPPSGSWGSGFGPTAAYPLWASPPASFPEEEEASQPSPAGSTPGGPLQGPTSEPDGPGSDSTDPPTHRREKFSRHASKCSLGASVPDLPLPHCSAQPSELSALRHMSPMESPGHPQCQERGTVCVGREVSDALEPEGLPFGSWLCG